MLFNPGQGWTPFLFRTDLLLLLALGLLFGRIWDWDVQWRLQGSQVIAAERCLP